MINALADMLESLEQIKSGFCKFHFGEEYSNVLLSDITDLVDDCMNLVKERVDDFPFRWTIVNEKYLPVLIIYKE